MARTLEDIKVAIRTQYPDLPMATTEGIRRLSLTEYEQRVAEQAEAIRETELSEEAETAEQQNETATLPGIARFVQLTQLCLRNQATAVQVRELVGLMARFLAWKLLKTRIDP